MAYSHLVHYPFGFRSMPYSSMPQSPISPSIISELKTLRPYNPNPNPLP